MTATSVTARQVSPMTLTDRCDTCGVQAFVRAVFVSGELTFCGHHGRELLVPLRRVALRIEDGTDLINGMPSLAVDPD